MNMIIATAFQVIVQQDVGALADSRDIRFVWCIIALAGGVCVLFCLLLKRADKKAYPLLYTE